MLKDFLNDLINRGVISDYRTEESFDSLSKKLTILRSGGDIKIELGIDMLINYTEYTRRQIEQSIIDRMLEILKEDVIYVNDSK